MAASAGDGQSEKCLREHVALVVDLLGLEGARSRAAQLVDDAVVALELFGGKADLLSDVAPYIVARKN